MHRSIHIMVAIAVTTAGTSGGALAQDVLGETGITGAGSTFVYPVLSLWSREYRAALARGGDFPLADSGLDDPPASTTLAYEPIGSLAGTQRLRSNAVDFAATEMPLTSAELAEIGAGQFPLVIGGVVVAVNVAGVASGTMRVDGPVLADIYLGKITRWSHPAIAALNRGLLLPDAPIAVVRRSDGSGTSYNFTAFLSATSVEWKQKVGSGLQVSWPVGSGAKGNEGVGQAIKSTANTIGYLDHAQAGQLGLATVLLRNRSGRFVAPSAASFQAAARAADWSAASDFHRLLIDTGGDDAYPIAATVFVLMRRVNTQRTRATLDFFRWSLEKGAPTATRLGYVPLPDNLVQQIRTYWRTTFPGAL